MLVLASASPRRRDLLSRTGLAFEVIPADIAECAQPGEAPEQLAERLAIEKARCVAERLGPEPERIVLGSDTIVVRDEAVLGKPRDRAHAEDLLASLVGRSHRVLTGIAVVRSSGACVGSRTVESRVTMRSASAAEIHAYVATGETLDKAGGYALQGEGRKLVTAVEGSETNVIGLPLEETLALLRRAGVDAGAASS